MTSPSDPEIADLIAAGMRAFWRRRIAGVSGGESRGTQGLFAACTGLATDLNVVLVRREPRDAVRAIGAAERWLAARGWPIGLEVEDRRYPTIERAAADLGLRSAIHRPAMVLSTDAVRPMEFEETATIRRADAADLEALRTIETVAFGTPPAVSARLITKAWITQPGVRVFLAAWDGEPVATATTSQHRGALGMFGVAVVPRAQRRGIGTAVTTHAIAASRSRARFAWLNPTEEARALYERMGFRVASIWSIWLRATRG